MSDKNPPTQLLLRGKTTEWQKTVSEELVKFWGNFGKIQQRNNERDNNNVILSIGSGVWTVRGSMGSFFISGAFMGT